MQAHGANTKRPYQTFSLTQQLTQKFAKGLPARFQKWYKVEIRCVHRETLGTNIETLKKFVSGTEQNFCSYASEDVQNAYGFGLCYKKQPDLSFSFESLRDLKRRNEESRVVLFVA